MHVNFRATNPSSCVRLLSILMRPPAITPTCLSSIASSRYELWVIRPCSARSRVGMAVKTHYEGSGATNHLCAIRGQAKIAKVVIANLDLF